MELSDEQRNVLHLALRGTNIFLTGPAGNIKKDRRRDRKRKSGKGNGEEGERED